MKIDFHVHSLRSPDSRAEFAEIYAAARAKGLSGLAVCDHNTFSPPPPCDDLLIIPGCEYSTTGGHLLALFLTTPLEHCVSRGADGLFPWEDLIAAAHQAGALVFLAHPGTSPRSNDPALWQAVDGVEVYNARAAHSRIRNANRTAQERCAALHKPFSAGSDAHFPNEVGSAYWECADVAPTLPAVRAALLSGRGRVFGGCASPFYRPMSQWIKLRRAKNFRALPKLLARFAYACLCAWRKPPAGYLDMEGAEKS